MNLERILQFQFVFEISDSSLELIEYLVTRFQ